MMRQSAVVKWIHATTIITALTITHAGTARTATAIAQIITITVTILGTNRVVKIGDVVPAIPMSMTAIITAAIIMIVITIAAIKAVIGAASIAGVECIAIRSTPHKQLQTAATI